MKKEIITYTDPKSPIAEMFKTLRTNIQFMSTDKKLKTLLVTSSLPGEGKSWTTSNLAVAFAQTGKKVIIVDADMRKGRQFDIFGVKPTPGLSNYLSGVFDKNLEYKLDSFVQKTEVENLYIMPAGNVPPNPSELLVSSKMTDLIDELKQEFDIAIFDGTPCLILADARILSRKVDYTVIVAAYNETKIDSVSKTKSAIENVGGKIAGVVINKIPISSKRYENSYYYYGNKYGYGYGATQLAETAPKKGRLGKHAEERESYLQKEEEYMKNVPTLEEVEQSSNFADGTSVKHEETGKPELKLETEPKTELKAENEQITNAEQNTNVITEPVKAETTPETVTVTTENLEHANSNQSSSEEWHAYNKRSNQHRNSRRKKNRKKRRR